MAENNDTEKSQKNTLPGQSEASKTTVAPLRDPMSMRDTDTGNLKRLTPGQAKKTIKLKPLTARSTTSTPAAPGKPASATAPAAPDSASATAPKPIKLKPVATVSGPTPLTAKSSAATIKITPRMKTTPPETGEQAVETEPASKTIKLSASASAPTASSTAPAPIKPTSAAPAAPTASATAPAPVQPTSTGLKLSPIKPGSTSGGLKPVMSGTASGLKPITPAAGLKTASGLKPIMPGTASGLKPITPAPTSAGGTSPRPLTPLKKPTQPSEETDSPEAADAAAPKKLSLSRPSSAPDSAAEADDVVGGKKESGGGLKLKSSEQVKEVEDRFEKELEDIQGTGKKGRAGKVCEPGIIMSLCNFAAMVALIAATALGTVQYLNHWMDKNIELPGMENIADRPLFNKKTPAQSAPAAKPAEEKSAAATEQDS